jgi:hypothetical protein
MLTLKTFSAWLQMDSVMKTFLSIAIIIIPLLSSSQPKTYIANKKGNIFICKTDTIVFSEYFETVSKTKQRQAYLKGLEYKFIISKTDKGPVKEIFDKAGKRLASISLQGKENSVRLDDGTELIRKPTGKSSSDYFKDNREAIMSYHYALGDEKYYVVQYNDSTLTNPVLPLIALDYWNSERHSYHNKKKTGPIIATVAGSTMLVLIGIALEDSASDF